MSLADKTLEFVSGITKKTPYFRGLGRLYRVANGAMLKLGAEPVVAATMKDSTVMYVDLRTITEVDAYYRGVYDSRLLEIIRAVLDPDACFLDIGANIGFYTVSVGNYIRSQHASGRVIAFEPFQGNYDRLAANLSANDLDVVCTINKYGLSNESTDAVITLREDFRHGSKTGNASIPTSDVLDNGFSTAPIKLERLDDNLSAICGEDEKIDFIKIDIEGHEDFCLQGAQKTIRAHRPVILMEVNKPFYDARRVNLDEKILPLIPEDYSIFRRFDSKWKRIESLTACSKIDNVFLIPDEKFSPAYSRIFN